MVDKLARNPSQLSNADEVDWFADYEVEDDAPLVLDRGMSNFDEP